MLVIPAVDIKDRRCVRLYQGEMDRATVYFDNPVDAARHWADQGASWLHVVDLNGAVLGRPVHRREIAAICAVARLRVELGGGLRSLAAVEEAFALGVERVVIGTAAYEDQKFLRAVTKAFPHKVVVGIDARDGKVAVKGWTEKTPVDAVELARRCEDDGASRVIYTDIGRDGTALGADVEATSRLARALRIPLIASGGVGSLEDIRRLKELEKDGVEAVIVGRALYSGAFKFTEAIEAGRIE